MNSRLRLAALFSLGAAAALLFRLGYWQLVRGAELSARADSQHFEVLEIPGQRGEIKTGDGMVLAGSQSEYLLYVYKPSLEMSAEELSGKLAKILAGKAKKGEDQDKNDLLDETRRELRRQLDRKSVWEPLGKGITLGEKTEIEQWNVKGLGFEPITARYYPEASSSAHILGFVGKDNSGKQKGYFGLEGFYDRELKGEAGRLRQEKDASGKPILVGSYQEVKPVKGRSLVLHLDRFIQTMVEEELKAGIEKYGASAGEAVIMEPQSGAVIASASYPNYEPGNFEQYDPVVYRNPVVSETYEPGSTFKILVMAAALNEGVVKPDTGCDLCGGPVKIGQYQINTWDGKYRPGITMAEVIVHSDNIGMVFAGLKLGSEKLADYLRRFGIGELTGVDLQGEVTAKLRDRWGEIDTATASFGQGIAVTTIQMIKAVAAIANGGWLVTPQVVAEIEKEDGVIRIEPQRVRRVISAKTAAQIGSMMEGAVTEGEAKFAAPQGYRLAGKTGTAQIPIAGHYDEEKTIASFVGFGPVGDPKFVMIVKLKEPASSPWGSETAAPLWFNITKKLLWYWGIPPQE